MEKNNSVDNSNYRLKPTLLNALLIAVVYVIILAGLNKLSGVPYTEIIKSSTNMLYGVLIPVFLSSIILTIISLWSGWWKDLWRDKYQIKGHNWMYVFLILSIIAVIANFLGNSIGSLDESFIFCTFIATAFVGYSEELLTRGILVRGARGSGLTEIKVFLVVMFVFGCLHGINIIAGQAIIPTLIQMIYAGLMGGVYYVIFRKNGFLVIPMILHWMFNFSSFTSVTSQISFMALVALCAIGISYLLLIPAAQNLNVKKDEVEEIKAS